MNTGKVCRERNRPKIKLRDFGANSAKGTEVAQKLNQAFLGRKTGLNERKTRIGKFPF